MPPSQPEPSEPDPATANELDVARYINALRAWGRSGWTHFEALKEWATAEGEPAPES